MTVRASVFVAVLAAAGCGSDSNVGTLECDPSAQFQAYPDLDGDTYGDTIAGHAVCKLGANEVEVAGDCDDSDATRNPDGVEVCDGLDNDCNVDIDDGLPRSTYYTDADGDGFGSRGATVMACAPPPDSAEVGGDCDDTQKKVHPGANEICDGADNDCDDAIDDADTSLDATTTQPWSIDRDGDGYGDSKVQVMACANPDPLQLTDVVGDCNDENVDVNPGASEVCDKVDNDCDHLVDDADPTLDLASATTWYADADGDGLGDDAVTALQCVPPAGYVDFGGDCNDGDPALGQQVWVADLDGDGVGAGAQVGPLSCTQPYPGLVQLTPDEDCNDNNNAIYPGAAETCGDGIDQDCSGGDQSCGPIGSYDVADGVSWTKDPPVYSCLEACAVNFGGAATDYQCSTSPVVITNTAYVSGWGDATYCTKPIAEDYSKEQAANPGYNCGSFGCAYSAFVQDNCFSPTINWCWPS